MAQCLSFYTWCSSLGVNCYLYTDNKRTTPVGAGWVSDGSTNWAVDSSGKITGQANCEYAYYAYRLGVISGYSYIDISWKDCSLTTQYARLYPNNGVFEYFIDCALEGSVEASQFIYKNKSVYAVVDPANPTQCSSYFYPTPTYDGSTTNNTLYYKDCNGNIQIQYFYNPNSTYQPGPTTSFTFCAKGSVVFQGSPRVTKTSDYCPPYGTFLNISCTECNAYNVYADGNGGTYEEFSSANSSFCCENQYYCSCWGYDCDAYPNPCYYYGCSECFI